MKRHPPAKLKVIEIDGKDTCEKLVELVRDIPIPIAQAVFYMHPFRVLVKLAI